MESKPVCRLFPYFCHFEAICNWLMLESSCFLWNPKTRQKSIWAYQLLRFGFYPSCALCFLWDLGWVHVPRAYLGSSQPHRVVVRINDKVLVICMVSISQMVALLVRVIFDICPNLEWSREGRGNPIFGKSLTLWASWLGRKVSGAKQLVTCFLQGSRVPLREGQLVP